MTVTRLLQLFLAGVWFAGSQLGTLFLLQTQYTANIASFVLTTTAWLTGAALGVWILDSRFAPWLWLLSGLSITSISALWSGSHHPWAGGESTWLLLVLASLVAGQLFTQHFTLGSPMGQVFFVEATGFTAGTVLSAVLLMLYGLQLLEALPWMTPILALLSERLEKRGDSAPR